MDGNSRNVSGVNSLPAKSTADFSCFSAVSLVFRAVSRCFCPGLSQTRSPKVLAFFASWMDAKRCLRIVWAWSLIGNALSSYGSAMIVGLEVLKAMPKAWNIPPPTKRKASTSLAIDFTLL